MKKIYSLKIPELCQKTGNFLWNYRYPIILAAAFLLLIPDSVLAAANQQKSAVQELNESLSAVFRWILSVIYPLVWMIIGFVGSLMDNSFILDGQIEGAILQVWKQIRNYVNIIFVVILLFIAIYNILGRSEGNFVLKTVLPKFVIALIAVNFSFFIGKFILDINNIATTAVFSLPTGIFKDLNISNLKCYEHAKQGEQPPEGSQDGEFKTLNQDVDNSDKDGAWYAAPCKLPRFIYVMLNEKVLEDPDDPKKVEINDQLVTWSKPEIIKSELFDQNTFALILAHSFFRIQDLIDVASTNGDLSQLTINAFFSIMFLIIYGVIFLAIGLVLLGRAAVIWISLSLAPLVAIFYVLEGMLPESFQKFDMKALFLKHAFAPFMLSVPITLSFILLNTATNANLIDHTQQSLGVNSFSTPNGWPTMTLSTDSAAKGFDDARAVLWYIAIVVLLWTGVKQAAEGTLVGGFVTTIMDKVRDAGRFVAQLPAYIPIVPMGPGKRTSLMGIGEAWNKTQQFIRGKASEHAENIPLPWTQSARASIKEIENANHIDDIHNSVGGAMHSGLYRNETQNIARAWAEKIKEVEGFEAKAKNYEDGINRAKAIANVDLKLKDKTVTTSEFITQLRAGDSEAQALFTKIVGHNKSSFDAFADKVGIRKDAAAAERQKEAAKGQQEEKPKNPVQAAAAIGKLDNSLIGITTDKTKDDQMKVLIELQGVNPEATMEAAKRLDGDYPVYQLAGLKGKDKAETESRLKALTILLGAEDDLKNFKNYAGVLEPVATIIKPILAKEKQNNPAKFADDPKKPDKIPAELKTLITEVEKS